MWSDKSVSEWPKCGGANGSIRFDRELDHPENKGLLVALTLLESIKDQCYGISWADLIQMSGSIAIELLGGPKINLRYGRIDATDHDDYSYQLAKNLPKALPPYPDGCLSIIIIFIWIFLSFIYFYFSFAL